VAVFSSLPPRFHINGCNPQFCLIADTGYAGAISQSRNFSGWQKKYTKSENNRYLGQC
jgi:hypothetical protein